MGEAAKRLLQDVLALPVDERRQLTAVLVDSLDESEPDWDRAWRAELDARLERMRSGEEEEVSLADVRRRLGSMISR